jgi:hypothetical protein
MIESQEKQILEWMLLGCKITAIEALNQFGCLRLAGRISDIKKYMPVKSRFIKVESGKRVKEYWIETKLK